MICVWISLEKSTINGEWKLKNNPFMYSGYQKHSLNTFVDLIKGGDKVITKEEIKKIKEAGAIGEILKATSTRLWIAKKAAENASTDCFKDFYHWVEEAITALLDAKELFHEAEIIKKEEL